MDERAKYKKTIKTFIEIKTLKKKSSRSKTRENTVKLDMGLGI